MDSGKSHLKALIKETYLFTIKDNNMAMEISSASAPNLKYFHVLMGMAQELNLPITFASDAHCINTVGCTFDELAAYANRFG